MIIKYISKMFCEIFVSDKGQNSEKTIPTNLSCCKPTDVQYQCLQPFPDQAEYCHGSCICLRIGVYFGNVNGIRSALILKVNDIRLLEISFVFFIQCGIVGRRQSYTQFYFDKVIFVAFGCIDFLGDTVERKNKNWSVVVLSRIYGMRSSERA